MATHTTKKPKSSRLKSATKQRPGALSAAKGREKAFNDGKVAAMAGCNDEPPYKIGDPLRPSWLEGWNKEPKPEKRQASSSNAMAGDDAMKSRKNQFDPEKLEADAKAESNGHAGNRQAGLDSSTQTADPKPAKPRKTDREKWEAVIRADIRDCEAAVCQSALDLALATEEHKTANTAHKALVKRLGGLHAKIDDPQGHLHLTGDATPSPITPLPSQKALPLDIADQGADPHAAKSLDALGDKAIKSLVGPDEFKRLKASELEGPVGLSAKEIEKLNAAEINSVGELEKRMREDAWWHQKISGFGESRVNKVINSLRIFRAQFPMPAEPEVIGTAVGKVRQPTGDGVSAAADKPAHEVAMEAISELLQSANELVLNGLADSIEFAESVIGEASQMKAWIEQHQHVTDEQSTAIANWREGVAKWQPVK